MRFSRKWAVAGLVLVVLLVACGPEMPVTPSPDAAIQQRFEQGNQYIQSGEFDKAIAEFQAVLAADPKHVSALTNLGVAYYNAGRLDEAIDTYGRALAIEPGDADIHSNLAAAHVQKNELDKALAEYQKAVELNPTLAQAYFGLGVVYLQMGKNDEARAAFEQFQKNDDKSDPTASEQAKQYLEQLKAP